LLLWLLLQLWLWPDHYLDELRLPWRRPAWWLAGLVAWLGWGSSLFLASLIDQQHLAV
jgi:hypothetical protein